ncbi:MAG TPA: HAMP domain-containing sensor histidine kinase, partial [Pyrinomonadaceae bacterium]|nr:HAMP domain-containing sensor histidine kinase [Pyrinomonadaceae bacterium]
MTAEAFSELAKIFPEPTVLVSSGGEILSANSPFLRAVNETQENLKGKNLAEISSTPQEKLRQYLQNCSRSRQMIFGALNLRQPDDEYIEYRCEGAVVQPAGDNEPAMIFLRLKPKETADRRFILLTQKIDELNKEIIERKRAEDESRKLYHEAIEANRLKDEFLATVSHELRTPLNAILGWSRMLRTNNLDEAHFAKALETIERNARSQTQLIEDLLDVSRIITGKLRLDVRPLEIASVVEAAVESLRPTAENKAIRLQVVLDPRAGLVSGDSERLQQAIWNLLSNAIKFTPKRGRVQVRLERVNSHIEIIVSDTGMGIE